MDFYKLPQYKVVYCNIALRPVIEESSDFIYPRLNVKVLSWKESISKSFNITKCRIELLNKFKRFKFYKMSLLT